MNNDFIYLYEELSVLHEAKQDRINFLNYIIKSGRSKEAAAGEVERFDKLKAFLKSPENDYYYGIKKDNYHELMNILDKLEHDRETKKLDKQAVAEGVELVNETEHGKIYKITNYEAARTYGRDTEGCITGLRGSGSRYGNDYTKNQGFEFWFIITKEDYDPRGEDSKFAIALNTKYSYKEIYNQKDNQVSLDDIPYYDEIEIPEHDLDLYSDEAPFRCENCGELLSEDEVYGDPDGIPYCEDCGDNEFFYCSDCGDAFKQSESYLGADDELYCMNCGVDRFYECPQCWETKDLDDSREGADGEYYCNDCGSDMFVECENCRDVIFMDDAVETEDGTTLCADCARDLSDTEDQELDEID